jgi:hypothetical protein
LYKWPCSINGPAEFSAANTGQYGTPSGTTVTGGATFGDTNVQTDLDALNTLSTTLGGVSNQTPLNINTGGNGGSQTINLSSYTPNAATPGIEVFSVSSLSFNNGSTLYIDGDTAGDSVVFNIIKTPIFRARLFSPG